VVRPLGLVELNSNFLNNIFPAHPVDADSFVAAGLATDYTDGRLLNFQHLAEESNELTVGFATLRRGGDFHLEHPATEARYLIPAGVGTNLQQQPVIIGLVSVIQIDYLFPGKLDY
jgi:hypothetical protein